MSVAIAVIVSALIFEALNVGYGALLGYRGRDLVIGVLVVHAGFLVIGVLALVLAAVWGWAL